MPSPSRSHRIASSCVRLSTSMRPSPSRSRADGEAAVEIGVGGGVAVAVGSSADVAVGVAVGVSAGSGVGTGVGVVSGAGGVAVAVGSSAEVAVGVAVGVSVGSGVGVGSGVDVGVAVAVGSTVDVAVGVALGSGVGAGLSLQALRTTAMARTVRTASQPIREGDTVILVVYLHVVLELPETGSGELECSSSGRVSISERAVSGPERTSRRKFSILSSLVGLGDRWPRPRLSASATSALRC